MVQLWVLISWAFVYEKSTCLKGIFYWWSHSFGGVWRESTTIQIFTVEGILSWWRFARTNWTSTFWMVTHFIREFQFAVRHPKLEMSICSISIHWENNNHTVREFLSFHYKLQSINKIFFLWIRSQVIPTFSMKLPKLPRHGQMHSFDRFLHPQVM